MKLVKNSLLITLLCTLANISLGGQWHTFSASQNVRGELTQPYSTRELAKSYAKTRANNAAYRQQICTQYNAQQVSVNQCRYSCSNTGYGQFRHQCSASCNVVCRKYQ